MTSRSPEPRRGTAPAFAPIAAAILAIAAAASAGPANASGTRVAQACGWFIVLGCARDRAGATLTLERLGGPGVGGWAGARVVDTATYPNFRDGWFCVADGPYASRADAESIAWREVVPDAYVKRGC